MNIKKIAMVLATVLILSVSVQAMELVRLSGLTRENAAVQMIKQLGYEGVADAYDGMQSRFTDVTMHKGSIKLVQDFGVMNGVGNNRFGAKSLVNETQSAIINERLTQKLNQPQDWVHGFYAIASSEQMELIAQLDAVSFGWAQMQHDDQKGFWINTDYGKGNDFRIPTGFHKPIDFAKAQNTETYLMVYFENQQGLAEKFLKDSQSMTTIINQLVKMSQGVTKDGVTRSFDGITIDFENFRDQALQVPFNQFLQKLDQALEAKGKKLNVAVQPYTYFKGYDYRGIGEVADKVILMAHDYAPKKLTEFDKSIGNVYTPVTPITQVYKDLEVLTHEKTGVRDKNKVVLQISFGSVQWQTLNNQVIHDYPYTPGYDKIKVRLETQGTTEKFDPKVGNPYAVYVENGVTNTIWYENQTSVELKENLVKLLGLGGVSYWRLGNIPKQVAIRGLDK